MFTAGGIRARTIRLGLSMPFPDISLHIPYLTYHSILEKALLRLAFSRMDLVAFGDSL